MCARYSLAVPDADLQEYFELLSPPGLSPRYNVAPSQPVAVVGLKADGQTRGLIRMTWGFVPRWADHPRGGPRPVNAKAETVTTSPPFRDSFRDRRCLLPASGFLEWETTPAGRVPYLFRPGVGGLMAFAGVWDVWKPKDGSAPLSTCAVVTVPANATVCPLHHRMPAILPPEHFSGWLDCRRPPEAARALLATAPDDLLTRVRVNPIVNRATVDGPECLNPA